MSSNRMSEFIEQLEGSLRAATRQREQQMAGRRRLAGAGMIAGAVVVVGTGVALSLPTGSSVDVAHAAPPAIDRPAIEVNSLRDTAPTLVARGARLSEVRSLPAPGGKAYLVPVANGWCLVGPDPATDRPQEEYALSCVSESDFMDEGIWLHVASQRGSYLLVAPPAGARAPEITQSNGATRPLMVRGGVALESQVDEGATVVMYDRNGGARQVALPDAGPLRPDSQTLQDCGNGSLKRAGTC